MPKNIFSMENKNVIFTGGCGLLGSAIDSLYRWEDKGFVKGDFADGSIILGTRADNKIEYISAARDLYNVYREQLDHFIRAIRGEVEPENKAESAIMSTLLMQAQKEAVMCGHEVNIFHPIGRRPLDGGPADGAFCQIDTLEYMKQANERRFSRQPHSSNYFEVTLFI